MIPYVRGNRQIREGEYPLFFVDYIVRWKEIAEAVRGTGRSIAGVPPVLVEYRERKRMDGFSPRRVRASSILKKWYNWLGHFG